MVEISIGQTDNLIKVRSLFRSEILIVAVKSDYLNFRAKQRSDFNENFNFGVKQRSDFNQIGQTNLRNLPPDVVCYTYCEKGHQLMGSFPRTHLFNSIWQ